MRFSFPDDMILPLQIHQSSDSSFMMTPPSPYDQDKVASLFASQSVPMTSVSDHLQNREGRPYQILERHGSLSWLTVKYVLAAGFQRQAATIQILEQYIYLTRPDKFLSAALRKNYNSFRRRTSGMIVTWSFAFEIEIFSFVRAF